MDIIFDFKELNTITNSLWQIGQQHRIWCFNGDLGSGKTTIIANLSGHLGVRDGTVASPTFSIVNQYESSVGTLYHIDAYRLVPDDISIQIELDEIVHATNGYVFIEWSSKIMPILPPAYFKIDIYTVPNEPYLRRIVGQVYTP
ncbi:MAG: tRNA (adenosine(37)-N6)-threonylcarbamoyltransferase complex ATPase subunit type 1 TsaE [Phycisphaerales bacterium]|nr:tRNA (adenosine(37)-N6)-threonylcarbamoyltransferase complex ATPase subunit type 1 TsaE [Phycisphaerales bacterium]